MTTTRTTHTIAALAAGVALTLAMGVETAGAETYCVDSPGCEGVDAKGDLQKALNLAAATLTASDTIKIGPYLYTSPTGFHYDSPVNAPDNDVKIEGVPGKTTLSAPFADTPNPFTTLRVRAPNHEDSYVYGIEIDVPTATAPNVDVVGLDLAGAAAENVNIATGPAGSQGITTGIALGTDSRLRFAAVDIPEGIGAGIRATGATSVEDTAVTGGKLGIVFTGKGKGTVSRAKVDARTASDAAIACHDCDTLDVDNSVLRLGGTAHGLDVVSKGGKPWLDASHVTIVGSPPNDATALYAQTDTAGGSSRLRLDNSVLQTVKTTIHRKGRINDNGPANVVIRNAHYSPDKEFSLYQGAIDAQSVTSGAPSFVNEAGGDYRPKAGSELIDSGRAGVLYAPPPLAFDFDLKKRPVDADGIPGAAPDKGAYEYQAQTPVAVIEGPATAGEGQTVTLDGTKSHDPDPGDQLVYVWTLPDGSQAFGPAVQVTLKPGDNPVQLIVSDPLNKTSTTKHTVTASPPSGSGDPAPVEPTPDPGAPTDPQGPGGRPVPQVPAGDPQIPVDPAPPVYPLLSGVKVAPKRVRRGRSAAVRLTLGRRSALAVRVERRARGRWARLKTVRRTLDPGARRVRLPPLRRAGAWRVVVTARADGRVATSRASFRVR